MSGGIGVGFVGVRTYARRSALVPDGNGGTKVGAVFAADKEADETLGPLLQLNGIFWSRESFGLGWSLGLTAQEGASAADLGYYTGFTVTTISDSLVFTLAYYRQSIDTLGGGFRVGDPVPDSLQDPIPVTSRTESSVLLGVSYRIR